MFPGNTGRRFIGRLAFAALALGAGALVYKVVLEAGGFISEHGDDTVRATACLREEGTKLLAALVLARSTTWAQGWPTRLVLIGMATGLCFGGFENIAYLTSTSWSVLLNRSMVLVDHAAFTGLAISGVVLAQYLRSRFRYTLPLLTFGAAVAIHTAHNHAIRPIHAWLLVRIDDLPEVMTSEQWFGAPHYDELMSAVGAGMMLPGLVLIALMIGIIHRLAQTREARP